MINRFNGYESVQSYSDFERLPKGGYVLKVMGASIGYSKNGNQYVLISCDIAEGEHAGFYATAYRNNPNENKRWQCNYVLTVPADDSPEWMKRRFKTVIEAFEDSNAGYHYDWNETKLKGLAIGGVFNEREYQTDDGNIRRATNLAQLISVDKIREGKFKIPDDKLLTPTDAAPAVNEGFMTIPDSADETGLPFN